MPVELIISVAMALISPYCNAEIHVMQIPPNNGKEVWGEYLKIDGEDHIFISPDVPRYMLNLVTRHELGHCIMENMPRRQKARVLNRISKLQPIYSVDVEEEWAERFALSKLGL